MKKGTLQLLFFSMVALCLWMGNSNGRATVANQGNTGAPGDEAPGGNPRTCMTCHNSGQIQTTLGINLLDGNGNTVSEYQAGETYTIEVSLDVASGSAAEYGFQATVLTGAEGVDGPEVADFANPSANAKVAFANNTGRNYVEQNGPSATNSFTVEWTAPATGTGDVTIYSCGCAVNGNNQNSGDGAACNTLTVSEDPGVATSDIEGVEAIDIFPNPVADQLNVYIQGTQAKDLNWQLMSINGQVVKTGAIQVIGNTYLPVNVSQLSSGTYYLQFADGQVQTTLPVLKK